VSLLLFCSHFRIAHTAFAEECVPIPALKKITNRRHLTDCKGKKKFFSAVASGSSSAKEASRKVSKDAGARDRVPDDQARLFADVMHATARSLAT
jgi:hypothetical protein